ncbi:hypothetical protein OS493_034282, partial [Desmophyllum pertusum]
SEKHHHDQRWIEREKHLHDQRWIDRSRHPSSSWFLQIQLTAGLLLALSAVAL